MIALVFCGDLKYCPYIKRYLERLEEKHVEYKVYFWNRGGFELNLPENYYYYGTASELGKSKWKKLFDFIAFRSWVIKRIKTDRPDGVITLSTLTGVILGKTLYSKPGKYVFDIRDYSYEHIGPFYAIEKKVIENSAFTAISSKGYQEFLPAHEYVIAHNFNRNDIIPGATFHKKEGKIKFVWNGVVRYFDFQKQYLNALKNDNRFDIVFHGDGPELHLYQNYCNENGFTNVLFTGSYDNSMKAELLKDAGILNNCYGYLDNAGNKLKYAVSNRFYDGLIYHIPQLVEPEGFKPKWTKESKVGVAIPAETGFANKLYEHYQGINEDAFNVACDDALRLIISEDDEYVSQIDKFILRDQKGGSHE